MIISLIIGKIFKKCVHGLCTELLEKEEELNDLDRGSGDGDCGTTFKLGAEGQYRCGLIYSRQRTHPLFYTIAILNGIDTIPWDTPSLALLALSEFVEKNMGGTSGAVS